VSVIPFPSSRFTQSDISAIEQLCYWLTSLGLAGGWARHSNSDGSDLVQILNAEDDAAKYRFKRDGKGRYRVYDGIGRLLANETTIEQALARLPDDPDL